MILITITTNLGSTIDGYINRTLYKSFKGIKELTAALRYRKWNILILKFGDPPYRAMSALYNSLNLLIG